MVQVDALIVTCEHGGNRVPAKYKALYQGEESFLETHRGWDPGALEHAREIAEKYGAPFHHSTTTRLLVDLNRSMTNRDVFSRFTWPLPEEERDAIVEKHYVPYRSKIENEIAELIARNRTVLHLSVHSYTPVLDGDVRNADVGLLYDPACKLEVKICKEWHEAFEALAPGVPIRRNYPYAGTDDGFTRALRELFPPELYAGIELELNHRDYFADPPRFKALRALSLESLWRTVRLKK